MKKSMILFSMLTGMTYLSYAQSISNSAETTGPEAGVLVIMGGGSDPGTILPRFIELAGGVDAPIVIIPTAAGQEQYDDNGGMVGRLKKLGATNVIMLHTNDKKMADSDEFVKPLVNARAVWFGGGRQWRLVDAYKDTQTEKLLWQVLARGGVIGGSSAGATIQGSYLARGDTRNNQIMMGDHEEGFGFIKNVAIDQHVLARNRQFDMFDILKNRPELLGLSIDESTAIVVSANTFEVIGKSYVLVYDGSFWSREGSDLKTLPDQDKLFYFLEEGDQYDLKARKVLEK